MTPLRLRVHLWRALPAPARRALVLLDGWELNFLEVRLVKRGHSLEDAKRLVQEYRRYLALSVLSQRKSHVLAGPVDQVWHEHILHTLEYDHFCRTVFGTFIHHSPSSLDGDDDDNSSYRETVDELKVFFPDLALDIWPCRGSSFCDKCRDIALEEPARASELSLAH